MFLPLKYNVKGITMFSKPKQREINDHTSKLIVGLIALSLATVTNILSGGGLESISASYYEGEWPRNIFVGFLFAIAAFLLSYNGITKHQMILSKVASFAALGVALFPCVCKIHQVPLPYIHGTSAAVMFIILAIFCRIFYQRAMSKGHTEARIRAAIYALCGSAIVASILILAFDEFSGGSISDKIPRLTFIFENVGLISFGIAWLTASRYIMFITRADERYSLFHGWSNNRM